MFFVPPFGRYRLCNALAARGFTTERVMLDEAGLRSWRTRLADAQDDVAAVPPALRA
jgi:hypothetical protein